MSSTHVGQLTLLDGSAEQVAAQVQVASYRDTIDAVHEGTIGCAVNRTAGWIRLVDGATFELRPQASTIPGGGDGLRAFTGPETSDMLNIRRGALTPADRPLWPPGAACSRLRVRSGRRRPQWADLVAEYDTRSNPANAVTSPSTDLLTSSSTSSKIQENPPPFS